MFTDHECAVVLVILYAAVRCVAGSQSPIDLEAANATKVRLPALQFKYYHSPLNQYFIENTGHGCQVTVRGRPYAPSVRGGPLRERYVFQQAHFHWGKTDRRGSEHLVDGRPYAMEAHLVHWNSKYRTYADAASKADGLAVIGFFLQCVDCPASPSETETETTSTAPPTPSPLRALGPRPSSVTLRPSVGPGGRLLGSLGSSSIRRLASGATGRTSAYTAAQSERLCERRPPRRFVNVDFQRVAGLLPRVRGRRSRKIRVAGDLLAWAAPHLRKSGYFAYAGSLTTPPFSENVVWIVYKKPLRIGRSQIAPFRLLEDSSGRRLRSNFRDLQHGEDVTLLWVS